MISINDVRKKYPQYNDLSDQQLADSLHSKYYSDMPKEDFYNKIGLSSKGIAQEIPSQQQKPILDVGGHAGMAGRLASDVLAGAAEGGQSLHNLPYSAAKTLDQLSSLVGGAIGRQPGFKYADYAPQPTNLDFAQMFGAKNNFPEKFIRGAIASTPYLMTGESIAKGVKELAPEIAEQSPKLAKFLAGASAPIGYGASGGLEGITQTPESPFIGGTIGAVSGAVMGAIPKIPSLMNFMRPQKYLETTMETLGGGKDVNEITKSLASDIKNNADSFKQQYKEMLKPVQDEASGYNLYRSKTGIVPNTYKPLAKKYEGAYLGGAKKLHEDFIDKPTFDNAHKLQSQLGTEARKLKGTDVATSEAKTKLNELRDSLKFDINNFLDKQDPTGSLSKQYNNASDFYLNEYVPYKNIKTLSDVMGQKGASSTSLLGAFKNPKFTSEGKVPDALKVANDLGEQGKNKIIALELAKKKNLNPKSALKAYENLETTGLSEYVTPSLDQAMKGLNKRMLAKKIAIGGVSLVGLNELRKHFPINFITGGL